MVYSNLNLRSTKKCKPAWQKAAKAALAKKRLASRRLSQIIESERIIRLIGANTNYREEGDEKFDADEQLKARRGQFDAKMRNSTTNIQKLHKFQEGAQANPKTIDDLRA